MTLIGTVLVGVSVTGRMQRTDVTSEKETELTGNVRTTAEEREDREGNSEPSKGGRNGGSESDRQQRREKKATGRNG